MLAKILMAACLVAITVTIHAAGLGMVLTHVSRFKIHLERRFWPITWLLIRVAWLLIVIHLFEIAVWGLFFWWQKCLRDASWWVDCCWVSYTTVVFGVFVLRIALCLLG